MCPLHISSSSSKNDPQITASNTLSPSSYTTTSTTTTNYEEKAVSIFNNLIEKCKTPLNRISTIDDISTEAISSIYKFIFKDELPEDYIATPGHDLEKVSNIELLISKISEDLGVNLSYIDAAAVVAKETVPLHNLVEILDGLYDFRADKNFEDSSFQLSLADELLIVNINNSGNSNSSTTLSNASYNEECGHRVSEMAEETVKKYLSNMENKLTLKTNDNTQKMEDFYGLSEDEDDGSYLPKLQELDVIWEKGETQTQTDGTTGTVSGSQQSSKTATELLLGTPCTDPLNQGLPETNSDAVTQTASSSVKSVNSVQMRNYLYGTNTSQAFTDLCVEALKSPKQSDSSTLFKQIQTQIEANQVFHTRQKSVPENAQNAIDQNVVNPSVSKKKEARRQIQNLALNDLERYLELEQRSDTKDVKKYLFGSETASLSVSDNLDIDKSLLSRGRDSCPTPSAGLEMREQDGGKAPGSSPKAMLCQAEKPLPNSLRRLSQASACSSDWSELLLKVHANIKDTKNKSKSSAKSNDSGNSNLSRQRPKTASAVVAVNQRKKEAERPVPRNSTFVGIRPKTALTTNQKLEKRLFNEKLQIVKNAKNDHLTLLAEQNGLELDKLKSDADRLEKASKEAHLVRKELDESLVFKSRDYQRTSSGSPTVGISAAYQQEKLRALKKQKKLVAAPLHKKFTSHLDQEIELYDLIPKLIEEYPAAAHGGDFPPEDLHKLFVAQAKQINCLGPGSESNAALGTPEAKQQKKLDENIQSLADKYNKLAAILERDTEHASRHSKIREKRVQRLAINRAVNEQRQHKASVRRFYKDYSDSLKNKLAVDRTKQQLVFRNLCEEALQVQKNRIREQREVVKEKKLLTIQRQKKELEKLENDWRYSLDILTDQTKNKKVNYNLKTKAHQDQLRSARLGVRDNLKKQLNDLCDHIVEEDRQMDEFREKDIGRLREEVLKMKFKEVC